jgi:hypothetical protein
MDALGLTQRAEMLPGTLGDPTSLTALMGGEHFKPSAEYPADFKITAPGKPRTESNVADPRGLYGQLKQEIATFIAADGDLVGLMSGQQPLDDLEEKGPLLVSIHTGSEEDLL